MRKRKKPAPEVAFGWYTSMGRVNRINPPAVVGTHTQHPIRGLIPSSNGTAYITTSHAGPDDRALV